MEGRRSIYRYFPTQRLLFIHSASIDDSVEVARIAVEIGKEVSRTLHPETAESTNCLKLKLPFHSPEQLGAAVSHGPVGIDVILTFCRELSEALEEADLREVVCVQCSRQVGVLANTVLLVGAFLIISKSFSAADLLLEMFTRQNKYGVLPDLRFPMPWKQRVELTPYNLTVSDCIHGLEVAVNYDWLDFREKIGDSCIGYDAVPIFLISLPEQVELRHSLTSPLPEGQVRAIPVSFWVAADPVTTVADPLDRPDPKPSEKWATVKRKKPAETWARTTSVESRLSTHAWARATSAESAVTNVTLQSRATMTNHDPRQEWQLRSDFVYMKGISGKSPNWTPEQLNVEKTRTIADHKRPQNLSAFAHWLRDGINCKLLVRHNFTSEPNLPGESYCDFFSKRGVEQLDQPFLDGTAPSDRVVSETIDAVCLLLQLLGSPEMLKRTTSGVSVIVHCKSGLGRSMSILAALAVSLFPGLSSSAFFGWARLVRPGCIQTFAQERFMRMMDEKEAEPLKRCLGRLCSWAKVQQTPVSTMQQTPVSTASAATKRAQFVL